ncbi:putative methyltransferase Cher3 [Gammaproteobacteria bacterium]
METRITQRWTGNLLAIHPKAPFSVTLEVHDFHQWSQLTMTNAETDELEIDLFVETLRRRHGYDFSHYARASLKRRVLALASACGCTGVADLIPRVVREAALLPTVLSHLSVPVTEMFRDPVVFRAIRERIVPILDSYPRPNIWQAGCATGEEVYSLAILLQEEGLLHKTQIYATDINDAALAFAEEGVFSAKSIHEYADNYVKAGGKAALSDYFHMKYELGRIDEALRSRMVFAHHNLVSDGVFCEVQMVICRNVLIYFDRKLQDRVLSLFLASLTRGGILCVGTRENMSLAEAGHHFLALDNELRLFKKMGEYDGRVLSSGK